MFLTINPDEPEPLFEQLATELRRQITQGDLPSGKRLPSARMLAETLGINLHTVLRAYQGLQSEGLIVMRPGRGATVVAPPPPALQEIQRLLSSAVRLAKENDIQPPTLITSIKDLYQ